ncbi:MAG: penicillin-binding protein [Deltaproteobacteria bacterium]|jgi:penicillin-binding protein 1A|nr:penicillin-binding protein [Deltaproteobacteria bacterium]
MLRSIITTVSRAILGSLRLIKFVVGFLIVSIVLALAALVTIYFYFAQDLPEIASMKDYRPPVISEVFAKDGTRIGEYWTECRIFLPYDEIPKQISQAFIDAEDARFFEHSGVDAKSIFRAFIANIRAGHITQGGSTITQQITRSLLLTPERKLSRKIKEAILAVRLERHFSKEQILTLYLNQIYLGNRSYGVAAAARNYFHKDTKDLSLGQIALIAGLPTAPSTFSPVASPKQARNRQLIVLNRMVEEGHITEDQAKAAADEHFEVYVAGVDKSFNDNDAAYFTEYIRRIVKEEYGDAFLYHNGLRIYTTVDLPLQRAAVRSVRAGIEKLDRRHGWRGAKENVPPHQIEKKAAWLGKRILIKQYGDIVDWPPDSKIKKTRHIKFKTDDIYEAVVSTFRDKKVYVRIGDVTGTIDAGGYAWARPFSTKWLGEEGRKYINDPKTILKIGDVILVRRLKDGSFALAQEPLVEGALLAMTPGTGFIEAMVGGYDFGRSEFNRVTQALRQPGSAFKPFVYAAALDKGYTFDTAILDAPVEYRVGRHKVWRPKNYGGKHKGPTPFRNALKFSRNIPTVKITYDIGTHYLTAYTRKLGITTPIEKYLSMSLGSNAVYLKDMIQAYSVFANNGKLIPSVAITKIVDSQGEILQILNRRNDEKIEKSRKDKRGKQHVKKDEDTPKTPEMIIQETDLNPALFREGLEIIDRDKLVLTDLEIRTLYGEQIPPRHVISPQTAYLMTELLKGVVEGGTGTRVRALGKPAAGKTGTTNDETDVWFIGFVPKLLAGVWVGFDELKPIGKRVAGGNTAAPIFLEFMKEATKDLEADNFIKPSGLPHSDIASLTGGSALFGARPNQDLTPEGGGADRAGRFFEEDLEEIDSLDDFQNSQMDGEL